jgi:hypothetical protein
MTSRCVRLQYLALAAVTFMDRVSLWARALLTQARICYGAQALQPKLLLGRQQWGLGYTGTSPKGGHALACRPGPCAFCMCVSERDEQKDAHLRLPLHVGTLRKQRHKHLQVAILTGGEERRLSVLQHRPSLSHTCTLPDTRYTHIHRCSHAHKFTHTCAFR